MSNIHIEQIKCGAIVSCQFDPFGKINNYIISSGSNTSTTSIPIGNDHFNVVAEYISEQNIVPKYSIEWAEEVRNKQGELLHYNTNLGPFVDSTENKISLEIKNGLLNGDISLKTEGIKPLPTSLEVSVFLPKHYTLKGIGSSAPIKEYSLNSNEIGLPFSIPVKLMQRIEPDYFGESTHFFQEQIKYTKGIVLRFIIDAKKARSIYNWSKHYLFHEADVLDHLLKIELALYKRKSSQGPRTNWYFDWRNIQQYIWVPTLHITNKLIGLINQQARKKSLSLVSKDAIGDMACIRVINKHSENWTWPISTIHDSHINIFPEELNGSCRRPLDMAFNRVRFLFDQGLYFEALVVTQAILESIVNGMFDSRITRDVLKRHELKWEEKYKYLKAFFKENTKEIPRLNRLFNGGFKAIYDYRNHFSHDFLNHLPDYSFNIEVYEEVKNLITPFIEHWEEQRFLSEVSWMYERRSNFLTFLTSKAATKKTSLL